MITYIALTWYRRISLLKSCANGRILKCVSTYFGHQNNMLTIKFFQLVISEFRLRLLSNMSNCSYNLKHKMYKKNLSDFEKLYFIGIFELYVLKYIDFNEGEIQIFVQKHVSFCCTISRYDKNYYKGNKVPRAYTRQTGSFI